MNIKQFTVCGLFFLSFLPQCLHAQEVENLQLLRGSCMPDKEQKEESHGIQGRRSLPARKTFFDASKTYRQLVVLVNFSDSTFRESHTPAFYDKLFNNFSTDLYEGKTRKGDGCVADYFRDQSNGKLNLSFDILGPYQVNAQAQPTTNQDWKASVLRDAVNLMVADQTERDFSPYDWDGDGYVDQVIILCASLTGNVSGQKGFLHPNTGSFSSVTTHDGLKISNYSASAELWTKAGTNCGIATICHEFTHSLGLPDIYKTTGSMDIIVDEWDLMDGGNLTNYGWCPPNYSALEKQLLGWLEFEELTEPATITDMKPVAEGGKAYVIRHTDNEYYLLENRQRPERGWDAGLPGQGLIVWHVNYNASRWRANSVNNYTELGFQLVYADNMDYNQSLAYAEKTYNAHWANLAGPMSCSYCLCGSPYPYIDKETVLNNELTDTSTPAATMYNANSSDSKMLGKSITNIQMTADGLISFDFMGGATDIRSIGVSTAKAQAYYDLSGRPVTKRQTGQLYIMRKTDGTISKQVF